MRTKILLVGLLANSVLYGVAAAASLEEPFRAGLANAIKTYRPLAEQGSTAAQNDLATFLEFGGGKPDDYAQALAWYRKAADQNLPIAEFNLARMYERGHGVPVSYGQALMWLHKAADHGYGPAQEHLGDLYAQGRGVPKDLAEAVRWFRMVAERGGTEAQFFLGLAYAGGGGVTKDSIEAYKWFTVASSAPMLPTVAKKAMLEARAQTAAKMSPGDITEAERHVRDWKPISDEDRFVNSEWEGPGSAGAPLASLLPGAHWPR